MTEHDQILVALRRITRAIDLQSKRLLKETGLTAPQLVVLRALEREGPLPPSKIADRVSLSPATVTTIVERLTRLGLVERRPRESDRRGVEISLTEAGRSAYRSAPELLQAGFLKRFRALEPWEQHMLLSSMERIADLMDAGDLDAAPILASGEYGQAPQS